MISCSVWKIFFRSSTVSENRLFNLYAAKTEATKNIFVFIFLYGFEQFCQFSFSSFSHREDSGGTLRWSCQQCFHNALHSTAHFLLLYSSNVLFVKAKRFKINFFLAADTANGNELIKTLALTFSFGIFGIFIEFQRSLGSQAFDDCFLVLEKRRLLHSSLVDFGCRA